MESDALPRLLLTNRGKNDVKHAALHVDADPVHMAHELWQFVS